MMIFGLMLETFMKIIFRVFKKMLKVEIEFMKLFKNFNHITYHFILIN